MIDWIAGIAAKANGWTVVVVLLIGAVARELIPAAIKWKGATLEERKYADGETKEGYIALITDLKEQVKELKANVGTVLSELKEVRAAHINCEVGQAELRGEMNVMKEQMAAIHRHEKANSDNTRKLAELVKEETGKSSNDCMSDHDKTALAEIAEYNRVLLENGILRRENQDLRAHCLNLMGKLEVVENPIPQPLLDLASTHTLEIDRNDKGSTIRRLITHHMGS